MTMTSAFLDHLTSEISEVRRAGLYKSEHMIVSPQGSDIQVRHGARDTTVVNFCANNYLGLADSPDIIDAAKTALDKHGYGMASVRFICGTQDVHKTLESRISRFLGTEDTILYASCFDANTGLFETIMGEQDAVISDALNHASIIDGVRLCKAQRFRYTNNDMGDLERCLQEASGNRFRLIATDGVFSMDGIIANLPDICDLADTYDAMVMVDDSHAVGVMGDSGRGTPEHCGVSDRIDIYTGTLGKALGGALGGYTSGRGPVIQWLRQRSRPYLFSNSLAPSIAAASVTVIELLERREDLRKRLRDNADRFRSGMIESGFDLIPGEHPIIPIMLGDARLAAGMAEKMLERGIYVVGFSFPVVPRGKARIRTQISAAHSRQQIDQAIAAFSDVGREMGIIN